MDVLQIQNIHKYFGGLHAVNDLTLTITPGEVVGLIGPNGAGKTTLFNLITGTYRVDQGEIKLKGEKISHLKPHHTCRKGIGRTFQVPKPLLGLSVMDNVIIAAYPKSRSKREAVARAKDELIFSGLWEKKDFLAKHLTLAEKKLLEVTRALTSNPVLLLLDEVMAGLNKNERAQAISLIEKIKKRNISILVIEHIFKIIVAITHRVIVLDQGQKIAEGSPDKVMQNKKVIKAYFGADYAFT